MESDCETQATTAGGAGGATPPAVLREFISRLLLAYRRIRPLAADVDDGLAMLGAGGALELAAALLHHADSGLDDKKSVGSAHPTALAAGETVDSAHPTATAARPLQVAVLGPTQTGKSTVVNLLLGAPAAEVSPLAGFTIHPQGFCLGSSGTQDGWTTELFPGWRRQQPSELRRDEFDSYALTGVGVPPPPLPPCVVWDTPDFDSLAARRYVRGLLEVAALADLYVLVVSKEKYSDLSAWRVLELLAPLGRPLIIVLNKLTPDAEPVLLTSLRQRLAERGTPWGDVPIVPLPYDVALGRDGVGAASAGVERLRATVAARLSVGHGGPALQRGVAAYLRRHWDAWLAPVRGEQRAVYAWREVVETAGVAFVAAYVRDYLEHPQRYDGFRRATVALLTLLEVPQVAGPVARARQLVTWPMRRLLAAGRAWWEQRHAPAHPLHSLGAEVTVLVDTLAGLLAGLHRDVLRNRGANAVWRALGRRLHEEHSRLRQTLEAGIVAHHEQVDREIRLTADQLYAELKKQPARLAALRTARVTLDVGSLLLTVKTAGLTPWDVVWAPAAFAAASLLMEGIAGVEFSHAAHKLKERQRTVVAQDFVPRVLVRELTNLATGLNDPELLGIAGEEVDAAEQALAQWESAA